MNKFHVGDIVTTLRPADVHQEPVWNPDMDKFTTGIVAAEPDDNNVWYKVRFTEPYDDWYFYREEWLESDETRFQENNAELDALFEEMG